MENPTYYRKVIGALPYLINTRPDIFYPVNRLSQYMQYHTILHLQCNKNIYRCLKRIIDYSLHMKASIDHNILGFSDADWTTNLDDRKPVAGYYVFVGEILVNWSSLKQRTISRSSTESEYPALADLATKVAWIISLLQEIKLPIPRKPILWCANLSAKALASNPIYHSRSNSLIA
ncbi:PREDICTED: uncharacterized protein LOC109336850 [Lupinus angustifolius]|uniref:uncharacterized protein LOC109336850 n=1 Tax=Lupinus angustifolius TaxID=3871 RepID=UPI00092E70CE|nr:PREDICTED: uncharacterized protein LOC109336850 [Lupinus angustifolius]